MTGGPVGKLHDGLGIDAAACLVSCAMLLNPGAIGAAVIDPWSSVDVRDALRSVPPGLGPEKFDRVGWSFRWPNGSWLRVVGAGGGEAEVLRGQDLSVLWLHEACPSSDGARLAMLGLRVPPLLEVRSSR